VVTKKDKYLAAAQKFLERGTLDKALAEFSKAVQEDAKDTRTWLRIAEIHVKRGDNEKATDVYLRTADLYVEQGFFQRAVAVYKNIIKLSPGFVEAYLKLADIYKQLGLLSDAMQQYEQAASALSRVGRTKEALAAMRQIVELNPDQPVSRIKLAEAASQAGMVDDAIAEFQQAGELLQKQGRVDEYLRVAERLLTLRPDDAELSKQVARQYIERNNARFALAKLQASFKVDPRDTETLDLLARAFEQLGQVAKAVSVLKELAKVYHDTGRANERVGAFKRIANLDPADPEARAVLSTRASFNPETAPPVRQVPPPSADRANRNRGISITFSEMAIPQYLTQQPESPPVQMAATPVSTQERVAIARDMLETAPPETAGEVQRIVAEADVFVKYGLVERAAEHLRKVFELEPTHTGARERLAAVLLQLGRSGEAVVELELLAEQLLDAQPNVAADYARRALDIDGRSVRAKKVLEKYEADQGEIAEELEELSSGMIEMETPAPEVDFDDMGEGTEGGGGPPSPVTAEIEVADDLELEPDGPPTNSAAVAYDVDPELTTEHSGQFDEFDPAENTEGDQPVDPATYGHPTTTTQAGRPAAQFAAEPEILVESEDPGPDLLVDDEDEVGPPRQPVPTPIYAARSAAFDEVPEIDADAEALQAAMQGDLEQVDFFLEQGLVEDAGNLLVDLEQRYLPSPLIDERRERLRALEESAGLGAVPSAEAGSAVDTSGQSPYATGPGITPKAMVTGGGEMDLAAHRDLGIGYKDMGLFDAAIGEFSQLMRDPKQEVFALSMIGECHESKGALGDAVAFYKKALNRPSISDVEATQLYFQLGSVFQTMGETNEALYFFEKVLKRDNGFRDVRRRVAELRGQGSGAARPEPAVFDALFEGKTRR
jgi:pilus assembly protein FimV